MKVIDYKWNKRNGNGQSTCHLCNKLTWDSWCYDFELKILDKELFNTVLCDDCISKIKQEIECKMISNEEIIIEKQLELYKTITYKDLEWYIIETNDNETRLLLKDVLDEERIKKYSNDDWYVNGCYVAQSDCTRAPFNWDKSYIKNTILSNFEKDIECEATLLTIDEAKALPDEVRKCNKSYWTKSNASDEDDRYAYAWIVHCNGIAGSNIVTDVGGYGVRPVITLSSKLL